MRFERLKTWLARILEAAGLIFLVIFFFTVFLSVMNVLFPTGSSLTEMLQRQGGSVTPATFDGSTGVPAGKAAAMLSEARNTVKSKREDAIAWSAARTGMLLYDQDAVQTLERSAAMLIFDTNNALEMGANTLMIIKSLDRDDQTRTKRSFLLMVEGDLHGKIAGTEQEALHLEIATQNATARFDTGRIPGQKTDFAVSINPDRSSTFTVLQGAAQVLVGGKEVRVDANTSLTVNTDYTTDGPTRLPRPVELVSPAQEDRYLYRDLSPRITFRWKAVPEANRYHFVLARDPLFKDRLLDERLTQTSFTHGKLPHSDYYWRVSALNNWQEGPFSDARQFNMVQKLKPPSLVVQFPSKRVTHKRCTLTGVTDPGARVFIKGKRVATDEQGRFSHTIELVRRVNIIIVEAVDGAGNVAYRSQVVNGIF